jgi:pimeloyl-ACP methyl ester carboxylesterase
MRASRLLAAGTLALAGASLLHGCALFRAQDDMASVARTALIAGTLETPQPSANALIVGLFRDEGGSKSLASYYLRRGPGLFRFQLEPGRYHLFAFEDRNESLSYDEGEPVYYVGARQAPIVLAPGQELQVGSLRLDRKVPAGVAELRAAAKRDLASSPDLARAHRGTLVDWENPRFGAEAASEGMWTPYEALKKYGAGMFFVEPYDPARVPVVFVHGINGSARDFKPVIDKLDRSRFQAWVFQYPSGFRLELVSDFLFRTLDEMQLRYRFERYVIVAHSMGGLVTRGAVNRIVQRGGKQPIALYVTISTPWEGHQAAEMGTRFSPVVLPVWLDMSPGSPYLAGLFQTQLPETLPYYLFFGFRGGTGSDGTVSLQSMLDLVAQEKALRVAGLPEDHDSILRSPVMAERLNALLARHAAP